MKEINLYSEAKPRYYQLIPNCEDGLILLALYQKYQKQEFTEDQIIQIISRWDYKASFSRLDRNMFSTTEQEIISTLIKDDLWIEEESNVLKDLFYYNINLI